MTTKVKSGIITAVFSALVVLLLTSFAYTFDPEEYERQNPPKDPPEGFEVSLGSNEQGLGENPAPATAQPVRATHHNAPENIVTQTTQHTAPVVSSPQPVTEPANPKQEVKPEEPKINTNALFTGRRNQQAGDGGKGNTQGGGTQGDPNGNPNSRNYSGNGGSNGNGSFSLAGRSAVTLPKPEYNSNQQGKIVVKIWVDQQGRVTRVEAPAQGSTLSTGPMVEQAKNAAKRARFNASSDAPEQQVGTITYIFKI